MYNRALTSPADTQVDQPRNALTGRYFAILLVIFLAYTFAGRANLYLITLRPPAGSIWVPAGLALAAVMLQGRRMAPAVFLGTLLVALTSSAFPWSTSLAISAGNTIEVLLASFLIEKFAGGLKAFSRPADFLRFCVAGGLSTAISAAIAAVVLYGTPAGHHAGHFGTFVAWWAGDALGVLSVTPFLVLLLNRMHHPLHLRELAEIVALLTGLIVVCVICFGPPSTYFGSGNAPILFCVPFLVWVAIRFCPLEAAGACLLLCAFATWGTLHGYGPFTGSTTLPLAAYLCMTTAMTLTGAATVASLRDTSEQVLEKFYGMQQSKDFEISRLTSEMEFFRDELTRRVHARSQSAAASRHLQPAASDAHFGANDVLWFLEAETENIIYVSPSYENVWCRSLEELKRDPHAWLDAVLPEDREHALLFVGQDFPGDRMETTYRVQRPDGSIRWIFDRGMVIRDRSGRPARYLGLATDITEQVSQGEVVPIQLEHRPLLPLPEGSGKNPTRRKQE
jgi:PAS domain S-box-containing protein